MPFVKNSISYNRVSSLGQVKSAAKCLSKFYHFLSDFNTENLHVTLPDFHHGNAIIKKFEEALTNGNRERLLLAKPIINEISNILRGKYLFKDKEELIDSMLNYLNQTRKEEFILTNFDFVSEEILVDDIDYYFSNVIAKNSKTMSECRSLRSNFGKTGTDG